MSTEIAVPDGYELVPVGEEAVKNEALVLLKGKWQLIDVDNYGLKVSSAGSGIAFPYGYYCRPKVSKP